MKEYTMYRCDFCGTTYYEAEAAEECEERHVKVKGVTRADYQCKKPYPKYITLEFEDGRTGTYERLKYDAIGEED